MKKKFIEKINLEILKKYYRDPHKLNKIGK